MISKPKSAKPQPRSNGLPRVKAAQAEPKSNGHHNKHVIPKPAVIAPEPKLEKFQGILQDFNLSPKGGIEGFLLHHDGQAVQINVTPDVGFAVVRGIGQTVEATCEPERDSKHAKGDHPVYNLVSLTGTDGKGLIFSGAGDGALVTLQGIVKRINYARHGAANGVVLDSGEFIHLKPEGMKKVDLKVGDQVTAEGTAGMMPLGQQVLDAKTVNGTAIAEKKTPRRG